MGDDSRLNALTAAAQVYDEVFVPAEFQEWAPRMVAAARIQPGQRVLDIACGTGALTREVARSLGPSGLVAGLDLNPGMIAVAARRTPDIYWCRATAESLPYADGSFDAVVSQFGLMFFPDRRLALREMRRVLKPGGRFAIAVWDTLENTPAYATFVGILEQLAGPPAANALRVPFALGDRKELAALFASAGLPEVTITTHHGTGKFPAIQTMIEADLKGWMPVAGILLSQEQTHRIVAEGERALQSYVAADGMVRFDSPAHIITG